MRLLFDVFIIIPHALSFPGVFAPNGVIGGGVQTTAWLYSFWHGGFALLVLVYAILANLDGTTGRVRNIPAGILVAVLLTGAAAGVLTLLATAGHDLLTPIMNGADYSMLVKKGISPAISLVSLAALVLLWCRRNTSALDLWLFVVMAAWLCDVALSAVVGSSRYDLGWYGGRSFGLVAASFLLLEASRQRTIGRRKTYYSAGTEILGAVKIGKGGDRRDVPDPASAPFGDVVEVARGRCSDRVGGCGKAHARQMDAATRTSWFEEPERNRSKTLFCRGRNKWSGSRFT